MNKKLKNLYNQYWDKLLANSEGKNAAHPLLLKVSKEYEEADIKVMIVGQETDGWNESLEKNKKSVEFLMDDYYHYLYNIHADKNKLEARLTKKRSRPFWNRKNFRFFQEELIKKIPDKKISFLWNNVSKIGKEESGKPTPSIQKLENKYFNGVFQKEIEILKPNIIIFVTGDRKIPISHNKIKKIQSEQVSEVIFNDFPDILAVRTYHPNAKITGGKKHLKEQVINLIINRM